jgi:hypothetical protein
MQQLAEDGFIRHNIFGTEIIWNKSRHTYSTVKGRRQKKHMFIFALAKRDALKYIREHGIKQHNFLPSVVYNKNIKLQGKRLTGADVDGAYWTIAFHLGFISETTYNNGLRIRSKNLCLAALSSLGGDKAYYKIKGGNIVDNEIVVVKGNDDLKEIYKAIRYTCYNYMKELAALLGDDFVCYKTDCIYYVRNKKNNKIVEDYLAEKGLSFKAVNDFKNFKTDEY